MACLSGNTHYVDSLTYIIIERWDNNHDVDSLTYVLLKMG